MAHQLPDFVYAGAGRAGSTYLHQVLQRHPDIFVPRTKDVYYFDFNYDKGVSWYADFFTSAPAGSVLGDISMSYYVDPRVPSRIKETMPDVKLLFCLREPVARAFSHYYWEMLTYHHFSRKEFKRGLTFQQFAKDDRIFRFGDYYNCLKPFFDIVDRSNIKVVFTEEIERDPRRVVADILMFLGVEAGKMAEISPERVNPGRVARFPWLAEVGYKLVDRVRAKGYPGMGGALRDSPLFNAIMFKPVEKDWEVFSGAVEELWPLYHKDDDRLEALLGRALPAEWKR